MKSCGLGIFGCHLGNLKKIFWGTVGEKSIYLVYKIGENYPILGNIWGKTYCFLGITLLRYFCGYFTILRVFMCI